MFIPFSTDAPLYFRPLGTLGLMVLNCLVFAFLVINPHLFETLSLSYGQGLTPLNWVTSNFVHAGFMHLFGNMIFLWSFGLIVEGKLGWSRFIPLFLAIGVMECAVEQMLFWNGEGISCGASAVIFGLMAICLLWAPSNDLSVFYLIGWRWGVIEVSVVVFALLTLAKSVAMYYVFPGAANELLHLLGAGAGIIAGFILLRTQIVDCEGWDLFSVATGNIPRGENQYSWQYQTDLKRRQNHKTAKRNKPEQSASQSKSREIAVLSQASASTESRFSELVVEGKAHAAFTLLAKIRQTRPAFHPSESELLTLARALRKRKEWESSTTIYQELVQSHPANVAGRIELGEIYVFVQQRPAAAKRLVSEFQPEDLTAKQSQRLRHLVEQIDILIKSGVVEIQT